MTPPAFLAECERKGIALTVSEGADGPRLRVSAAEAPPPAVVEYLKRHKPALIALLRAPGAADAEAPAAPVATDPAPRWPAEDDEELAALAAAVVGDDGAGWEAGGASPLVWTLEKAGRGALWFVWAAPAPGILGGGVTRRDALEDLAATVGVDPDATPEQAEEVRAVIEEALASLRPEELGERADIGREEAVC